MNTLWPLELFRGNTVTARMSCGPGERINSHDSNRHHTYTRKENRMKYTIVSDYDGNESFEVEAATPEDAALEALGVLGWNVCLPRQQEEGE
jgi:phage portal protein BeeE